MGCGTTPWVLDLEWRSEPELEADSGNFERYRHAVEGSTKRTAVEEFQWSSERSRPTTVKRRSGWVLSMGSERSGGASSEMREGGEPCHARINPTSVMGVAAWRPPRVSGPGRAAGPNG